MRATERASPFFSCECVIRCRGCGLEKERVARAVAVRVVGAFVGGGLVLELVVLVVLVDVVGEGVAA